MKGHNYGIYLRTVNTHQMIINPGIQPEDFDNLLHAAAANDSTADSAEDGAIREGSLSTKKLFIKLFKDSY